MKVVVIGGGIAGCSAAALLAEGGADVTLYEREEIAAGASGRNSGLLQHPMDEVLVPLYAASLELYAGLDHGFTLPEDSGSLVVSRDGDVIAADLDAAAARFPELAPEWLEGAALRAAEPALADGLYAYRLTSGRPIPPAAATRAWAQRAREAGAEIVVGIEMGADDARRTADAVVVAAGPWSPEALGAPGWGAVGPLWGAVAQVRLADPPRHTIEQAGVDALTTAGGVPDSLFSMVTAGGASSVGSTFTRERPDAAALAPVLLERGARYVPALHDAAIEAVRACARPLSADGRPLLGEIADGIHLLTGHGPWGITLGPGSARLVTDALLGRLAEVPTELAAMRFGAP
ncbi:MAG TPA: FAD-dependent oxidoreductase [Solirubrobacteraceae bacterium]